MPNKKVFLGKFLSKSVCDQIWIMNLKRGKKE